MIHIIPNLSASVATNMALMLVLIEELWLFGGVIGLMRVSRCTAHWGKGNRTLPPDASVVREPIPMVIIYPLIEIGCFQFSQRSQLLNPWYPVFLLCIAFSSVWPSKHFCMPALCQAQAMNPMCRTCSSELTQAICLYFLLKDYLKRDLNKGWKCNVDQNNIVNE